MLNFSPLLTCTAHTSSSVRGIDILMHTATGEDGDSEPQRFALLRLPMDILHQVLDRLTSLEIVSSLHSCGDKTLNRRMKQGGVTKWHDTASNVFLNRVEFASAAMLVSVSLEIKDRTPPLLNLYVRSLRPILRSLCLSFDWIEESFFCDPNDDGDTFNDALVPSHTYTCSVKPWLIRKSFPMLESLLIYGRTSDRSLKDPMLVAQHLAGLPNTLTELAHPLLNAPVIDIYQLLPPNLAKLLIADHRAWTCFPTADHALDSLEHLELFIDRQPHSRIRNNGHWAPTLDASRLAFPRCLTHLKLFYAQLALNTLPPLPNTLRTFILSFRHSYPQCSTADVLRMLPNSLTNFRCERLGLDYGQLTEGLDTLKTLPNLKHFFFECNFSYKDPNTEDEAQLWTRIIQLIPAVETFNLDVCNSRPTLGLHHLELFNKAALRTLTADLVLEEFGPIVEQIRPKIALVLPNIEVCCSNLDQLLLTTPTTQSVELSLDDV